MKSAISGVNQERFYALQSTLWQWQEENFGPTGPKAPPRHCFLGMLEESGELVHGILKLSQGIRGTREEHIDNIKDAIGDIMVYLINFFKRSNLGFVPYQDCLFNKEFYQIKTCTNFQLEMLSWNIYRAISRLGLYYEPCFLLDSAIPSQYHESLLECTQFICQDLSFLSLLLHTTVYDLVESVWVNVLSKRNWRINTLNGTV